MATETESKEEHSNDEHAQTDEQIVIMDIGSYQTKAGFCEEDAPRYIYNTVVGWPRHKGVMVGMGQPRAYVGDEVLRFWGILSVRFPICNGVCTNFDDWERVVHHTYYNELRVAPEEHPFLYPHASHNLHEHKSKLIQCMFETFNVPSMLLVSQDPLCLFANGRIHGLSWDSGYAASRVVPVYEGHVLYDKVKYFAVSGEHCTQLIMKQLAMGSYRQHHSMAQLIKKEKFAIPLHPYGAKQMQQEEKLEYKLPDGEILNIPHRVLYGVGEIYFAPQAFADVVQDIDARYIKQPVDEKKGIHQLIHETALQCDESIRSEMAGNVVLSGGNSLFTGLPQRLQRELDEYKAVQHNKKEMAAKCAFRVIADAKREHNVFIGASIYGSLSYSDQRELWMAKQEYDEVGPEQMYIRKCF